MTQIEETPEVAQRRADIAQITVDPENPTPDEVAWLLEADSLYANASHHGNTAFSTWADAARAVALLREERQYGKETVSEALNAGDEAIAVLRAELTAWLSGMDDVEHRYEVADSIVAMETAVATFANVRRYLTD
jgi:cytochrome oxidase Cu insertion factor (SCO1/SenC/PrrC family)